MLRQYTIEKRLERAKRAVLVILCGTLCIQRAVALDTIELDAGQPLTLEFNAPLAEQLDTSTRAVLLNGYDITAFATLTVNSLHIALDGPLQPGDYVVSVQQFGASGDSNLIYERQISLFTVDTSASGALLGNVFYRGLESDKEDFAGTVRSMSEAALRVQAQRVSASGSVTASADIQYRSDAGNNIDGNEFELPNYLVEARRAIGSSQLKLSIGHQNIGESGLVFDQFHRRGFSVDLASSDGNSGLSVFSSSSEPLASYRKSLVVPSNREESSSGANFRYAPFSDAPKALQINAGYIDGKSLLFGTGINYETGFYETFLTAYGGKSWNVALASQWLSGAFQFRAEYAGSDFDADGFGKGQEEHRDSAIAWSVLLSDQGDISLGLADFFGVHQWSLALQQQRVGPNFFSLGNITLPGDLDTQQVELELVRSNWRLNSSWVATTNNVDDRADVPDQKIEGSKVNLQYTPVLADPSIGLWSWLGRPALGLRIGHSARSQPLEDALLTGQELDDETLEYGLSFDFQHQNFQWRFEYSLVDYDNAAHTETLNGFFLSQPRPDNRNRFATLQFSYRASEQFSITPTVQWSRFDESDTSNTQESLNLGMQTTLRLFEDRLLLDINYSSNKQENLTNFDGLLSQRYDNAQFDALATWRAILPRRGRPGINFSLRTNWNVNRSRVQNNGQSNDESYQVLLGIQLDWQGES